jgi:CubicO group peptidase (beta-lactamase class C family)
VSGQDYETALGELVLKPAGMTETGCKAPRWAGARIAHGYREGEDWGTILGRIQEPGAPHWALRGNGGLHTTLADMVRWSAALQGDAVLTAASRESARLGDCRKAVAAERFDVPYCRQPASG